MGIAKAQFTNILNEIFKPGNVIKLYTKTPTEGVETDGILLTGSSVKDFPIENGHFSVRNGEVVSAENLMFYLYEGETVECDGFGVFAGGSLLYFGKFDNGPLTIEYNDVPAIKKYNSSTGEGIKITMQSTEVSASTT
jgi:hypothetical protein